MISATLFFILCFALNITTIFKYKKHRQEAQTMQEDERIEMKLAVYTIIITIGHLLMDMYLVCV